MVNGCSTEQALAGLGHPCAPNAIGLNQVVNKITVIEMSYIVSGYRQGRNWIGCDLLYQVARGLSAYKGGQESCDIIDGPPLFCVSVYKLHPCKVQGLKKKYNMDDMCMISRDPWALDGGRCFVCS